MKNAAEQFTFEDEYARRREELKTKMQALAHELLEADARTVNSETRESFGVTFYDVRLCAETRGWLNGEEKGALLSFGSGIMVAAGGVTNPDWARRKNSHKNSHRRKLAVYRLQQVVDAMEAAGRRA